MTYHSNPKTFKSENTLKSYGYPHPEFVFASEVMRKINFEITRIANLDTDVLLLGETGVGKDLIAHQIHRRSARNSHVIQTIPLRSLSETLIESELFGHEKGAFSGATDKKIGKLEAASGGTVYIPEISSISETTQIKLLNFMQYKTLTRVGQHPENPEIHADVRLIMASNDNMEKLVAEGKLREDFYYRVAGVTIAIPPLRERMEDVEPLVRYFLDYFASILEAPKLTIDDEALKVLMNYSWPGNIRELAGVIKSAAIYSRGESISADDIHLLRTSTVNGEPAKKNGRDDIDYPSYNTAIAEFKRRYIEQLLRESGGNISKGARIAGLSVQGLRKLMKKYGMLG